MKHDIFKHDLKLREEQGLLRNRKVYTPSSDVTLSAENRQYINFSSNDYLGLSRHGQVRLEGDYGSFSSPLVTGRHDVHVALENDILSWLKAPTDFQCLLFSSGYAANQGVINALFNKKRKNAVLLQDRLNHASMVEAGIKIQSLGYGQQVRFKHNDMAHLNQQLEKYTIGNNLKVIVTESVFSMDGDRPDLSALNQLAVNNNCYLIIDEAHAIGVLGEQGRGGLNQSGVDLAPHHIMVLPFGKGMGAQGAAVVADKTVIDYLVNFSKEYIYSTHISPIQTKALMHNLKTIREDKTRTAQLHDNIRYFKEKMREQGVTTYSDTAIQPIVFNDERYTTAFAAALLVRGILCTPIRYPTVAKNAARLRVTITASHTKQQIDAFADSFYEVTNTLSGGVNE